MGNHSSKSNWDVKSQSYGGVKGQNFRDVKGRGKRGQKILDVGAVSALPSVKRAAGNVVSSVTNMRIDSGGSRLVPMGESRLLTAEPGTPLAAIESPDGREWLLMAAGSILKAAATDTADEVIELGQLAGEAACAVAIKSGAIVMTSEGPERVEWDAKAGRWSLMGQQPEFPPITIVASGGTPLTATVAGGELTGNYPHGAGNLTADDRQALTDAALDAYRRIDSLALGGGAYVQPILACYRIKDLDGNVLYRSATVMVCDPNGFQATDTLTTSVTNGHRQGAALTMTAWKLSVIAPESVAGAWGERAAVVEILASRQLHAVRMKGQAAGSLTQDNATTSTLTFTMPGVAAGVSGEQQRRATVVAALDRECELMEVVARFSRPFSGGIGAPGAAVTLNRPGGGDTDSDWAAVERTLSRDLDLDEGYRRPTVARCSLPHRFSASRVAVSGDVVIWGNPVQLPYSGYPLPSMSAAIGTGKWRAYTAVEMADGSERRVWSGGATSGEPLSLSPLICFPDGNARSMTIAVTRSDGKIVKTTVALTPTAAGDAAYYLHPSLSPWSPTTESDIYLIPADTTRRRGMDGRVISATGGDPLRPTGALAAGPGAITALTRARRSDSTWDMGRGHFYAMGRWGVAAVGANGSSVVTGAALISTAAIHNPAQVEETDDGILALTRGGIIRVSGNRCRQITPPLAEAVGIGFNRSLNEIWVTDTRRGATIIDLDSGIYVKREIEQISAMYTIGDHLVLLTSDGLRIADDEIAAATEVEWRARVRIAGIDYRGVTNANGVARVEGVNIDLDSPSAILTARFGADMGAGSDESLPIVTLSIEGAVNKPLTTWLKAPRREWIDCVIAGLLEPGSSLGGVNYILNR